MLLSTTLLFATSSLAFLIPEINTEDQPKSDFLPTFIETNSRTVNLDCSTCPFALSSQRNGAHEWTDDVESELEMKFGTEGKTLKLNGVPFYPMSNPTIPPTLYVSQSKKDGQSSNMEGYDGNLRLSYSMEYEEKKFEDNSLVTVLMTVMGLDGQMIKVENIEVTAIKEQDGTLILHSTKTVPVSPDSPDAKCETILCRVFTKVITGMAKAKASAKTAGHKMKCFCMKCFHKLTGHKNHPHPHHHKGAGKHGMPHRLPDGTMELPELSSHIHFKPHSHGHHHHHKGFVHRMAMILRTTFKIVFVPILIGVAFGMAASAIGMLVGQVIVFLWMKYRGTSREAAYEPLDTDEKEAPPAYQDIHQGAEALNEKEVDAKA
ncbi:hypothetical protein HO173_002193 [Letharia columbiana]|uniref:DUF7728 domain-containing protein n=1 Tax=Letharia columbiana TaxID=112416 RepID=A0A8H6L8P1_9LECA|nr:uncharacterized protein HO173_002193 [Letharia columbiana]KAF6239647.1 hypothetical protein HO173_002193 [Letharia columbiana]